MGSWGYNIYQDDIAMDLKDDYISFLKKCNTDEEAEQKIIEWKKDNICEDEESLFWYVLAFVQYKYGRLSEKVKERALYYIDHPEEDENLELYKEAGEKAYKKRKEVLLDLKEKLLGEPLPYKKVTKYKNVYSKFKVGDVVSLAYLNSEVAGWQGDYVCRAYNVSKEERQQLIELTKDRRWIVVILDVVPVQNFEDKEYIYESVKCICLKWTEDRLPTKEEVLKLPFVYIDIGYENHSQDYLVFSFWDYTSITRYRPKLLFNVSEAKNFETLRELAKKTKNANSYYDIDTLDHHYREYFLYMDFSIFFAVRSLLNKAYIEFYYTDYNLEIVKYTKELIVDKGIKSLG